MFTLFPFEVKVQEKSIKIKIDTKNIQLRSVLNERANKRFERMLVGQLNGFF